MEKYKYYYKTDKDVFEIKENVKDLDVSNKNIVEVNLPPNLIEFYCSHNKLTNVILNNKLESFICFNNELTEIVCNENLKYLYCDENKLTNIVCNKILRELSCVDNKLTNITIYNKDCYVTADENVNITYKTHDKFDGRHQNTPNFNQTEQRISNLILKIKNPVLWSIADQLTRNTQVEDKETKFNIKEVKKLSNTIPVLGQMLTKKEGSMLLKKHSNGFNILDIENLSFELENKESLLQNKLIEIGHSTWKEVQRYFKDEVNYVFQVNLKPFKNKEILNSHPNKENLEIYFKSANHPTSKKTLTLAWVRYTYLEDKNAIVIDEIQTDLNDEKFLGEGLMKGWEEFTMRLFIQYVRKQYKIRKIYIPTYDTRTDLKYYPFKDNDTKLPPMYLYKELPNKFGFKKNSDMDGFMVLENNLFESFKDYLNNNLI